MNAQFSDYTFKEVLERADRGAGWLPLFHLEMTGDELLDWQEKTPKRYPSLNSVALSSAPRSDCILAATEYGEDGPRSNDHLSVEKDLYAIFATVAYIATNFGRETTILIATPKKTKAMVINPEQFTRKSLSFEEMAISFHAAMLSTVKIDIIDGYNLRRKAHIIICMAPSQDPN
jgi:hypothetical protein